MIREGADPAPFRAVAQTQPPEGVSFASEVAGDPPRRDAVTPRGGERLRGDLPDGAGQLAEGVRLLPIAPHRHTAVVPVRVVWGCCTGPARVICAQVRLADLVDC